MRDIGHERVGLPEQTAAIEGPLVQRQVRRSRPPAAAGRQRVPGVCASAGACVLPASPALPLCMLLLACLPGVATACVAVLSGAGAAAHPRPSQQGIRVCQLVVERRHGGPVPQVREGAGWRGMARHSAAQHSTGRPVTLLHRHACRGAELAAWPPVPLPTLSAARRPLPLPRLSPGVRAQGPQPADLGVAEPGQDGAIP